VNILLVEMGLHQAIMAD